MRSRSASNSHGSECRRRWVSWSKRQIHHHDDNTHAPVLAGDGSRPGEHRRVEPTASRPTGVGDDDLVGGQDDRVAAGGRQGVERFTPERAAAGDAFQAGFDDEVLGTDREGLASRLREGRSGAEKDADNGCQRKKPLKHASPRVERPVSVRCGGPLGRRDVTHTKQYRHTVVASRGYRHFRGLGLSPIERRARSRCLRNATAAP